MFRCLQQDEMVFHELGDRDAAFLCIGFSLAYGAGIQAKGQFLFHQATKCMYHAFFWLDGPYGYPFVAARVGRPRPDVSRGTS